MEYTKQQQGAMIIMSVDELFTDAIDSVSLFAVSDEASLRTLLRQSPPNLVGAWRQAIDIIEPPTIHRARPLLTFDGTPTTPAYAIWHHGSDFIATIAGDPAAIVQHADVTENEREELLIQVAQKSTLAQETLGIAMKTVPHPVQKLSDVTTGAATTIMGFVAMLRHPDHTAIRYARHAVQHDLRLLLLSDKQPAYIEAVGLKYGLLTKHQSIFDAAELLAQPSTTQTNDLRAASGVGHITPLTARYVTEALSGSHAHLTTEAKRLLARG